MNDIHMLNMVRDDLQKKVEALERAAAVEEKITAYGQDPRLCRVETLKAVATGETFDPEAVAQSLIPNDARMQFRAKALKAEGLS